MFSTWILRDLEYTRNLEKLSTVVEAASQQIMQQGVPNLEQTVETFVRLGRNTSTWPPKKVADLHVAAMGLLALLKKDQITLHHRRNSTEKELAPNEIPAMTAVVQDRLLFATLVRCLKPAVEESTGQHNHHHHHHHHHHLHHAASTADRGRKRALSGADLLLSSSTSSLTGGGNKALKLAHHLSPVPGNRKVMNLHHHNTDATTLQGRAGPTMNAPVLAATILYAALQHLDHWPACLMQAYAEDCFGPRAWVDHPQCRLLVENLALVHGENKASSAVAQVSAQDEADAGRVVAAYRNVNVLKILPPHEEMGGSNYSQNHESKKRRGGGLVASMPPRLMMQNSPKQKRRSSMSSVGSESSAVRNIGRNTSTGTVDSFTRSYAPFKDGASSDSGDEEEEMALDMPKKPSPTKIGQKRKMPDDGNSSSSGEEDEQAIFLSESFDGGESGDAASSVTKSEGSATQALNASLSSKQPPFNPSTTEDAADAKLALYPLSPLHINLSRVRNRFVATNLHAAHEAVGRALADRIQQKTKQNSGLLQALPSFTSIPVVRRLVAAHLEKWLQSPALAGLGRVLFSSTVEKMENTDPPLKHDLAAIDSILAMNLKANQFSAHLDNIASIAKRIPSAALGHHIFSTLFQELTPADSIQTHSNTLKMMAAVHKALPRQICYDAMAASLLTLLATRKGQNSDGTEKKSAAAFRMERDRLVQRLRCIMRLLASEMGSAFDGFALLEALTSFDVRNDGWSIRDEEDKARLLFQCVTLHVSSVARSAVGVSWGHGTKSSAPNKQPTTKPAASPQERKEAVRKALKSSRTVVLMWCCRDYGPRYASKKRKRPCEEDKMVGAGTPDFTSPLNTRLVDESIPPWLNVMRCLLFIEEAGSDLMTKFLMPTEAARPQDEADIREEQDRVRICCEHGVDLDDQIIGTVLRSHALSDGGLSAEMALQLLENLFESCGKAQGASLSVSDPNIVWELYILAQYTPPNSLLSNRRDSDDEEDNEAPHEDVPMNGLKKIDIPRLAYPAFWWRVTTLALILCGSSPEKIGAMVWSEHPTLRAMIKMVISTRYRFPTVDCDNQTRLEMKQNEQSARDEESRIAELLFLPPRKKKNEKNGKKVVGSRMSRRLLKRQQEKEAAAELAEYSKRKKMMKAAQKSIMLWDPDGPARKPPRESTNLFLSVQEMFGLSEAFQRCTTPDFILKTIGQTTRGAIERAYDWLIPVISHLPKTITRLRSSASCFLLLRAYGADGEQRSQLKELSAPLLGHVRDSLRGRLGEPDCVKALDILMSDVASHNPDRRKSARRVLRDSLGGLNGEISGREAEPSAWITNILLLDLSKSLVPTALKHMKEAAKFERGRALKALVMGLQGHIDFAASNNIKVEFRFPDLLMELISQRPNVYAEAMDMYSDFRSLVVRVIHAEFSRCAELCTDAERIESVGDVDITLRWGPDEKRAAKLPLSLLLSTCVVLSIWTNDKNQAANPDDSEAIDALVRSLMCSDDCDSNASDKAQAGLASAKFSSSKDVAVSVESWIMLCKARSEGIGKRAALSAPEEFLARLLLSSGLPRSSLLAMVDRLGRLGEASADRNSTYHQLLLPSASSEFDIGRVGHRRDVSRKLLGRLSAYLQVADIDESLSMTFLIWLSEECKHNVPKQKSRKKLKTQAARDLVALAKKSSVLSALRGPTAGPGLPIISVDIDEEAFMTEDRAVDLPKENLGAAEMIDFFFSSEQPFELNDWLSSRVNVGSLSDSSEDDTDMATALLQAYSKSARKQEWATDALVKWVPLASRLDATVAFWKLLFGSPKPDGIPPTVLDAIMSHSLECWTEKVVKACTEWILSIEDLDSNDYSSIRLTIFLLATSGKCQCELSALAPSKAVETNPSWGTSENFISAVCPICLRALQDSSGSEASVAGRNGHPAWLRLLLIMARCGKKQLVFVGKAILQMLSEDQSSDIRFSLLATFLRLYLLHPFWMDVGVSAVRSALVQASETHARHWASWRCTLDDKLNDLFGSIAQGDLRVVKPLAEISRKHPLMILRKSHAIVSLLEADATLRNETDVVQRGVLQGWNVVGPAEAMFFGLIVKVHIRHWGYRYTELLWVTVLDLLTVIPKEVLYGCGIILGVQDILNLVVQLLTVQLGLLVTNASNNNSTGSSTTPTKLKTKVTEMLSSFRECNARGYSEWLGSKIDGETEVRNDLVKCGIISPQEAIENLRSQV